MKPALPDSLMQSVEYVRNTWCVTTPDDKVTLEQVLEPSWWAHTARRLKAGDRIEVMAQDMTWLADLLVMQTGNMWAKVSLLAEHKLAPAAPSVDVIDGFEVRWNGPRDKFIVRRQSDGAKMQVHLPDRATALAWLADNQRNLAA